MNKGEETAKWFRVFESECYNMKALCQWGAELFMLWQDNDIILSHISFKGAKLYACETALAQYIFHWRQNHAED